MRIALINNNLVENVIVGELEYAQTLGYDVAIEAPWHVGPGWAYHPEQSLEELQWTAPEPEPARVLTRADFQRRFTPQQYFDAKQLTNTEPNMVFIFGLFESSPEVRLDHPDTQAGVAYMQHVAGILDAEDVARILA